MISIIVPVYNAENYLVKCLNDLRYQTYHKLEIILVDDGSTDASGQICERFARADSRFKVIHKKRNGLSSAYNAGLLIAKGKYVSFVSSMDRVDEVMFENLISLMLKTQAEIIICGYIEEDLGSNSKYIGPHQIIEWQREEALQKELNRKKQYGFMNNKLFLMDLFKQPPSLRFDPTIYLFEDLLMCIQCFLKSEKIIYTPTPYYHYVKSSYLFTFSSFITDKENLSGLTALSRVIELCEGLAGINVVKLKEQYMSFNLELLMYAYGQKISHGWMINDLKKNLYHYRLSELNDKKLQMNYLVARSSLKLSYLIWKLKRKDQPSYDNDN
ncbi:MAG: glycosyltransferase family 2 protein [Carnobacterium sp.]|uniref:glycosyltransferase family 2 protein n=1 Tax=Carnobacterium sp. TaxID=48221 RepID=UPI002FC73EB9